MRCIQEGWRFSKDPLLLSPVMSDSAGLSALMRLAWKTGPADLQIHEDDICGFPRRQAMLYRRLGGDPRWLLQ